jgi:hypothetical protein
MVGVQARHANDLRGERNTMRRIIVIGSGIGGAEAAATLATTVPDARITLVGPSPDINLLPNLVYVPFGMQPAAVRVPLAAALEPWSVECRVDSVDSIDTFERTVSMASGQLDFYDDLIVATGLVPPRHAANRLRTLDDALHVRSALASVSTPRRRTTIAIRVMPGCSWTGPAYEFALLLQAWLVASGSARTTRVVLATEELAPLSMFGFDASSIVSDRLAASGIELLAGMPAGRFDQLESDLAIDFGDTVARRMHGLPPVGADGFYETDAHGKVADHAWIVGDAGSIPYKGAFATAWQSQQVALELGGDLTLLGPDIDGVPLGQCEYQMDLAGSTLRVRFDAASHFLGTHADVRATVDVDAAPPQKLHGTLVRRMLEHAIAGGSAPIIPPTAAVATAG